MDGLSDCEMLWYAVYTLSHHEKRVTDYLKVCGIESFLPFVIQTRLWRNRKIPCSLPLFPNYIFVKLASEKRVEVARIPGVIYIVSSKGSSQAMLAAQIEALRNLSGNHSLQPHAFIDAGSRVKVRTGVFAGYEGILMQQKDRLHLVLSITAINRSFAVFLDTDDVEPVIGTQAPECATYGPVPLTC
jgi:transcription antitermination factor NusG